MTKGQYTKIYQIYKTLKSLISKSKCQLRLYRLKMKQKTYNSKFELPTLVFYFMVTLGVKYKFNPDISTPIWATKYRMHSQRHLLTLCLLAVLVHAGDSVANRCKTTLFQHGHHIEIKIKFWLPSALQWTHINMLHQCSQSQPNSYTRHEWTTIQIIILKIKIHHWFCSWSDFANHLFNYTSVSKVPLNYRVIHCNWMSLTFYIFINITIKKIIINNWFTLSILSCNYVARNVYSRMSFVCICKEICFFCTILT